MWDTQKKSLRRKLEKIRRFLTEKAEKADDTKKEKLLEINAWGIGGGSRIRRSNKGC